MLRKIDGEEEERWLREGRERFGREGLTKKELIKVEKE